MLTEAVANYGPISVAINAGLSSFQFYVSGVYYDPACDPMSIDHMLLVVGYGTTQGADYYIAQNSWGTSWGENGYIYLARNHNNNCGVATYANYPILA
jgi:cathepsin L